jgi:hypothetical protein
MGGARSGGTIVGGDGGRFELGRSPAGLDLGHLGPICARAGRARPCYLRFDYEQFMTWAATMTPPLLQQCCGPV